MTPEEKSLLERTYKLSMENNEILRGMRRAQRWTIIFRVLYWVVIIGASVGLFYFLQPYIDALKDLLVQVYELANKTTSLADLPSKMIGK